MICFDCGKRLEDGHCKRCKMYVPSKDEIRRRATAIKIRSLTEMTGTFAVKVIGYDPGSQSLATVGMGLPTNTSYIKVRVADREVYFDIVPSDYKGSFPFDEGLVGKVLQYNSEEGTVS